MYNHINSIAFIFKKSFFFKFPKIITQLNIYNIVRLSRLKIYIAFVIKFSIFLF